MPPLISWHTTICRAASYAEKGAAIPRPTNTPAQPALHALLGRWLPNASSITIDPAASGASTPVWTVEAGWPDGRCETFYLRLGEEPGERRDGEVRIHQLLTAQGVLVPEVAAWEGLPPELDRAATLTRAIPGIPLQENAKTLSLHIMEAIVREAGRDLAQINALPVAGYGWIDLPDATTGALRAECPSRGAWLTEYDGVLAFVREHGLIPQEHIPALCEIFAIWRDAAEATSSEAFLAHGDFDASHIFCAPRDDGASPEPGYTYTGIIDFGEARGADRLYDLGHALLHDGEDGAHLIFPHLLAGYRTIHPLPDDAEEGIRAQAIAIGVRHLAIAHRRKSPYADVLAARIVQLLDSPADG